MTLKADRIDAGDVVLRKAHDADRGGFVENSGRHGDTGGLRCGR